MNYASDTGRSPRQTAPGQAPAGQARGCGAAASRHLCAAVAIASAGLAAAGCSAVSHAAAATSTTTPSATATATTPAPTTAPPASPTPATAASPTGPVAAIPALGQSVGVFAHGQGFGQVKPAKIFNGGDPTGLVTQVVWRSWGGAQAVASGISDYVGPNQTVAGGTEEPVTVVAFKLGICDGRLMYQAVEWYFPQHKQAFDPGRYENVCTGTYVPAS